MVEWLFLAVSWGCLLFVIVVFSDHTHLQVLVETVSLEMDKCKSSVSEALALLSWSSEGYI